MNASPLIFLGACGLLDLLRLDRETVVVPEPVWAEVTAKGADPGSGALRAASWISRVEASPTPEAVLAWNLGSGESSVIAWALAHRDAAVVMDDLAGRRCARSFGVVVRGTLGLVLRGHRRGVVPDPRAALDRMRARGMWLGDAVVERALREAGVKPA